MPLISSLDISKKKGKEASIHLSVRNGEIQYSIEQKKADRDGTVARSGAQCACCGEAVDFPYIRSEGMAGRINSKLVAVVAEGKGGRIYITPDETQKNAAKVSRPENYPSGKLSGKSRVNVSLYGFDETSDLFTNRQLTALTTFCDLLDAVQEKAAADAKAAGLADDGISIADGGSASLAYAQAIRVYLSFLIDKLADRCSSVCSWDSSRDGIRNTFGRQAIPMVWDYTEGNPFCNSSGSYDNMLDWVLKCIDQFSKEPQNAEASQFDAQSDCGLRQIMVSTDPPYYDNIGYADLSDFFYVWLRESLKKTFPQTFRTLLVPKTEELVATPYRFNGSISKAKVFFENGMAETCKQLYLYSREDVPVTIYYAYKQSEIEDQNTASSGWETMLSAIIQAGFAITGTWPMRTEMANRSIASGTNALSTSIVLVCRKRPENAPSTTRRNFIAELKRELRPALQKLQASNIAPVDLAQSAIGPGMGVFSKYRQVLDADGKPMSVRAALQIINQELDVYFNEQDGVLDADSRFCVELYTQFAFNELKYGDADTLARAKNTSVEKIAAAGAISAKKGTVRLLERDEMPGDVKSADTFIWRLTQQLTHAMEKGGIEAVAKLTAEMLGGNAEAAKDLAYRLFTIADRKKWNAEAYAYNNLVSAWPDIQSRAAEVRRATPKQESLF